MIIGETEMEDVDYIKQDDVIDVSDCREHTYYKLYDNLFQPINS